ncbi:MAG: GGDEF domain-containing protein, partial [Thermodesulfobacteriota bacterium]
MKRSTILFVSIFLLVAVLITQIYFISIQYSDLKDDGHIINQAGKISGSIQRISKHVLVDKECEDQIQKADNLINKFNSESERYKHKGYSEKFLNYVKSLSRTWEKFKVSISNYKTEPSSENFDIFWHSSENAWKIANKMVLQAQLYSEKKVNFLKTVIAVIGLNLLFVFFIGFLINKYVRKELEFIASYDGLTKALNRTSFNTVIQREISHCKRYETPLSLMILDIDYFKNINDTFGHQTGDKV